MDTSEQYINMCRKATELQEMWEPSGADWVYFIPLNPMLDSYGWEGKEGGWCGVRILAVTETDAGYYGPDTDTIDEYRKNKKVFWLPRIDQLIEMYALGWKVMLQDILNFVKLGDTPSIESECIKAIMYYNHDKYWNGEDWIE